MGREKQVCKIKHSNMNTRFDERTVKVTDAYGLQECIGRGFKYFAKTHYKVWNEDFLDNDTGEIVSVEPCQDERHTLCMG